MNEPTYTPRKVPWTDGVLTRIKELIHKHKYPLSLDLFKVNIATDKILAVDKVSTPGVADSYRYNYTMDQVKKLLDSDTGPIEGIAQDASIAREVLTNVSIVLDTVKYPALSNIEIAHLISLLSDLCKDSDSYFVTANFTIRSTGKILFYINSITGKVCISEKAFGASKYSSDKEVVNQYLAAKSAANVYASRLNDIIAGKVEIPPLPTNLYATLSL
jgi:hypothetical protein